MELCAMHMKAQGQYLARSLSYRGTGFEIVREDLPACFAALYDECVRLWGRIIAAVCRDYYAGETKADRLAKSQMWGANQRFWAQVCMAAKVAPTVRVARDAIRRGQCVVIGLQSTGETVADGEPDGRSVEPSSSAAGILRAFIAKHCGKLPGELRDELLEDVAALRLPINALDELIHRLGGPESVAEMTGRKRRYVAVGGSWRYLPRAKAEGSIEAINVWERRMFQSGRKLVAIISEASSTGISLHADRRERNQRRRLHIVFQMPWSAEQAIQQMGRSHRSNQVSAPEFRLVLSSIGGERRFTSAVASRLQSLGALTQGARTFCPSIDEIC